MFKLFKKGVSMASFDELKTQLEGSFVAEGAAGMEASIQINIEGLTN